MATRPSKTIVNGCRILTEMAAHPRQLHTAASLAEACGGSGEGFTRHSVESALLAYHAAGFVTRRKTKDGHAYYLLGAQHLYLAMAELDGLLSEMEPLLELVSGDLAVLRRVLALVSNARGSE